MHRQVRALAAALSFNLATRAMFAAAAATALAAGGPIARAFDAFEDHDHDGSDDHDWDDSGSDDSGSGDHGSDDL